MTGKTFIRMMFLLLLVVSGLLFISATRERQMAVNKAQDECCPAKQSTEDNNQTISEMGMWGSMNALQ